MANLKGGNAIVRFLLAHGEKLGMLAILACAGMLIWSALGTDQLQDNRQPENLVRLTNQARQRISDFKWDDLDKEDKLIAAEKSGEAMAPIAHEHFPPLRHPLERPVLDPISLRMDPELLTVEDPEVHGDSGLWASADPGVIEQKQLQQMQKLQEERKEEERTRARDRGDVEGREGRGLGLYDRPREGIGERRRDTRSRRDGPVVVNPRSRARLQGYEEIEEESWVTLVAKVPVEKQFKRYQQALENSSGYNPSGDLPVYKGYQVERLEVTESGDGDWEKVDSVNLEILEKRVAIYPFDAVELISRKYIHPLLTHPLPSLILRDWDSRVTHSSIPLITEEQPDELEELPDEEKSDAPQGEEDIFASSRDAGMDGGRIARGERSLRGSPRRGFPGRGGLPGAGGYGEYGGGYGGEYGEGMMEGPMMEGGLPGRSGRGMRGGRQSAALFTWDGETPYALFRYFDDTVKPGHQYRYRVRLALADVNHDVSEQYLDKTVVERRSKIEKVSLKKYRFTEWSEPSPVASVPLPARIYLAGAEAAKQTTIDDEPEATVLVKVFNSLLPAELAKQASFLRGSVLNLEDKADVIWTESRDLDNEEELREEYLFRTGITVVDVRGGQKLSRRSDLTNPARALLMDPAGRLFLQSELDDSESVGEFQDAKEGESDRRGGFQGRGESGYGEGYFGGEGLYGEGFER